jgi:diguanylate cyclase (GGDEF)-like protein
MAWARFTTLIRGRSLILTTALSCVLLGLGAFITYGTVQTTRATEALSSVLATDALFAEARNAITAEEASLRHYIVEPSVASQQRFVAAGATAEDALRNITEDPQRSEASRLLAEQRTYRELAERLMALAADQDPARFAFDRLDVTPAFFTLQQDVDAVARAYHAAAEHQTRDQSRAQNRLLLGNVIVLVVGLSLVAMIWRLGLAYQRRLIEDAAASQHQALHDPLTGLPNRTLFYQELTRAWSSVAAAPDNGRGTVGLLTIDLNEFKAVNDTLGHQAGDQLLIAAGKRMRQTARATDIVARLGGDEFAVVLPEIADAAAAVEAAKRIARALRGDFRLDAGTVAISGSIGLALGTAAADTEDLVRHADAAMYRAKSTGLDVAVYNPSTDAEQPDRLGLFVSLRSLLDAGDPQGQLVFHYQPVIRLATGMIHGFEALVRWQHPERGLLAPGAFLPLVENRGLDLPLIYHLVEVAARQALVWRDNGTPHPVSVNVSPRCLLDENFGPTIISTLDRLGLPPELLRLEITEDAVMTDPQRAIATLRGLREEGIRISVDDFGTGYSSLSQLKHLPADEVKIDRTFIRDLVTGADDGVLVRGTIELAHSLGLAVVAEGVEDLDVLALLRDLGCDHAQGFALGHPSPAERALDIGQLARVRTSRFTASLG